MKPRVYVETSIVTYLTARPARDIVVAGRQQSTRDWWATTSRRFELVVSDLVLQEAAGGDPAAARARLDALASFVRLDATAAAQELTERLVRTGALPERVAPDAAHVAVAAANGIDYLVTWNFKHIANATAKRRIETTCRHAGFECPVICSPDELVEDADDEP